MEANTVVLTIDKYTELVERAVRAECEASIQRDRRWEAEARASALEKKLGGESDG